MAGHRPCLVSQRTHLAYRPATRSLAELCHPPVSERLCARSTTLRRHAFGILVSAIGKALGGDPSTRRPGRIRVTHVGGGWSFLVSPRHRRESCRVRRRPIPAWRRCLATGTRRVSDGHREPSFTRCRVWLLCLRRIELCACADGRDPRSLPDDF